MTNVWIHKKDLENMSNAINEKLNTNIEYDIEEIAAAILSVDNSFLDRNITTFNDNTITAIGDYAFYRCSLLSSVNLPNVTSIGYRAFYECHLLSSINLPNVTSIGNDAFLDCTSLTSITLPNVTSIENNAFSYCSLLTSITLSGSNVCTLGNSAFYNTPIQSGTGYIYVPANLVDTYKATTNWYAYASHIIAIPSE